MNYTSITPEQRAVMLEAVGAASVEELFEVIPARSRLDHQLDLPAALSELELQRELAQRAAENRGADRMVCFLGAGAYDHFIPAFIDQLVNRGEFLTAYTPYQPEASQGALQAFFEFQTQIARLTGMDIANASLYEGATAVAEAALLALNATGLRRVLVSEAVHPHTLATLRTYLEDLPAELVVAPLDPRSGATDATALAELAEADTAAAIVQSPNVFGVVEDWAGLFERVKTASQRALAIAVCNPIACALLRTPGESGADIAVGEGQPLGAPLQFGGPYIGFFAARKQLLRRMPGRMVGRTVDAQGRTTYSLVLQTREQHIRRERATSNICTNQGLLALRATMFMTAMGPRGLRTMAELCWHKAHDAARRIEALPGFRVRYSGPFFHEFVVQCPLPARTIVKACKARGILPGVALDDPRLGGIGAEDELLVAVTEKRTKTEIEALAQALGEAAQAA